MPMSIDILVPLQVGKPATFIVNFNGAEGKLRPTIITPSGRHVEALVQEVDDGVHICDDAC